MMTRNAGRRGGTGPDGDTLPPPALEPLGPPLRLTRSAEYGLRPFTRVIARASDLRLTSHANSSPKDVDTFLINQFESWRRRMGYEGSIKAQPDGTYQLDILDRVDPLPTLAPFKDIYMPVRDELRKSREIIVGQAHGGAYRTDFFGFPHAICGGSSRAGKSYLLKTLLVQIGDKSPNLIRLALGDPQGGDLAPFERLPHMIRPLADNVPDIIAMFKQIKSESTARQTFLRAPFVIRLANGEEIDMPAGFASLEDWNVLMVELGHPDLVMPHYLVVVDEWSVAMAQGKQARKLLYFYAGDHMRASAKWGGLCWLATQKPRIGGSDETATFPGDMMVNTGAYLLLARNADKNLWQTALKRNLDDDLPVLRDPALGDTPKGRGLFVNDGLAVAFQGMLIGTEQKLENNLQSDLMKLVAEQSKQKLGPEGRLLLDRAYCPVRDSWKRFLEDTKDSKGSTGNSGSGDYQMDDDDLDTEALGGGSIAPLRPIRRIVVDASQPGESAVTIEYQDSPETPRRPAATSTRSVSDSKGHSFSWRDPNAGDEPSAPRLPATADDPLGPSGHDFDADDFEDQDEEDETYEDGPDAYGFDDDDLDDEVEIEDDEDDPDEDDSDEGEEDGSTETGGIADDLDADGIEIPFAATQADLEREPLDATARAMYRWRARQNPDDDPNKRYPSFGRSVLKTALEADGLKVRARTVTSPDGTKRIERWSEHLNSIAKQLENIGILDVPKGAGHPRRLAVADWADAETYIRRHLEDVAAGLIPADAPDDADDPDSESNDLEGEGDFDLD